MGSYTTIAPLCGSVPGTVVVDLYERVVNAYEILPLYKA